MIALVLSHGTKNLILGVLAHGLYALFRILNTNYLNHSLNYSGTPLWNNLPQEVGVAGSLGQLKMSIDHVSHTLHPYTLIW